MIDDDEDARVQITRILAKAGYSVETAADGLEALRLLRSIRPGVIFLDMWMPGMNGAEFRQAQRRDRELLKIPTVVMTGDRAAEPLFDPAVEETLRKPITRTELLAIVEHHCGRVDDGEVS